MTYLFSRKIKDLFSLSLTVARYGLKLRNEGSYLGVLWYLINPALTFVLLWYIFSKKFGGEIEFYPLYLLLGIIVFNFFKNATNDALKIIRVNRGVVKSISFSTESLVVSSLFLALVSHLFEIILFSAILFFVQGAAWSVLFYLPILILLSLFILGLGFLLSSVGIYFFDLDNIWGFFTFFLWLATPIFYAVQTGVQSLINYFNPMYYFITASRDLVIYNKLPEVPVVLGMIGFSVITFAVGWGVFSRFKYKLVEEI